MGGGCRPSPRRAARGGMSGSRSVRSFELGLDWLLAIAVSFLLGALSMLLLPSGDAIVWDVGTCLNIGLALVYGVVLGMAGEWADLPVFSFFGVLIVLAGFDLLLVVDGSHDLGYLIASDFVGLF